MFKIKLVVTLNLLMFFVWLFELMSLDLHILKQNVLIYHLMITFQTMIFNDSRLRFLIPISVEQKSILNIRDIYFLPIQYIFGKISC